MDHILNCRENRKRGALRAKETEAWKKQQESWETSLSYSVRVRILMEALIKNHTFSSFQRKQRVTTVASGRSVKCNAIFAVWDLSLGFKTLLLICSPVWILGASNIWEHHAKVRTTNVKCSEFLSHLPFDNFAWLVHLAGVDSLNLRFLLANGFKLHQITTYWFLIADKNKPPLLKLIF